LSTLQAKLRLVASSLDQTFTIVDGLALTNHAHLASSGPAHPLNAVAGKTPAQRIEITIQKAGAAATLANVRDVVLWLEYDHTA
jgi:hypothetical protein